MKKRSWKFPSEIYLTRHHMLDGCMPVNFPVIISTHVLCWIEIITASSWPLKRFDLRAYSWSEGSSQTWTGGTEQIVNDKGAFI